ncbi:MAG: YihA family ribosome biogenesis GTP-binding protein [Desulfobacteraceae bacterium]|nr:MAG: YihA family ribosome biogenesis GTP-binding protein [Desulfobacteraceae bacterium]
MIISSAEFIKSATKPSHYPPSEFPEIAFAGRSNVGKSSLINRIVNRKSLVKTSSTPGRTQLINFFLINRSFFFVDLPGYGYAKVPEAVRKSWGPMVETYLATRKTLKGVVLIMDIRRIPRMEERNFLDWMAKSRIAHLPVLTKVDKLSKSKQMKQLREIADTLEVAPETLQLFSAKSGMGKEPLWMELERLLEAR